MPVQLDRLKSQLLTSGIQEENFALFQVINQLIQYLSGQATALQTAIGGSGSGAGLFDATYLTKEKEAALINSLQVLPGAGIQFNDASGKRIISTAIPFGMDGEQGEEGVPGPPGRIGVDGLPGPPGLSMLAIDGEDGIDGESGATGPQGIAGQIGQSGFPGPPGLDGYDGDIGEDGIPGSRGPQGLTGGNSGVRFWFDPTDASDIAGYKKALLNPSTNAESTIVQVCAGTGDNLLASFVSEPGVPGVYWIQPGAGFRHIHGAVTTVGGFARYLVKLYYCNADGTGETLVGSSYSDPTSDTSIDEVNWDLYNLTTINILLTQRLVWKLYVARVSGPANVSVTTYFEGLVHPSYVESTISGNQVGPPGPIGPTGASATGPPYIEPEEPEYPYIIPGVMGVNGPTTLSGTFAAIPVAGVSGRLYFPTNENQLYRDSGAVWEPWAPITKNLAPVATDFTWVNQGTAILTDHKGLGLTIQALAAAGESLKLLVRAIPSAPPWTIIAKTQVALAPINYNGTGIVFRESGTGEIHSVGWYQSGGLVVKGYKWNSPTSYSGAYADGTYNATFASQFMIPWWWKIQDDNTNRIVSFSSDGITWWPISTVGRTDFLTADQWGFMVNSSNATLNASITLLKWAVG